MKKIIELIKKLNVEENELEDKMIKLEMSLLDNKKISLTQKILLKKQLKAMNKYYSALDSRIKDLKRTVFKAVDNIEYSK